MPAFLAAQSMILFNYLSAFAFSLLGLRWALRGGRLLALLSSLAAILFLFLTSTDALRGFDLATFLAATPLAIVFWTLLEIAIGKRKRKPPVGEGEPERPRAQFDLLSAVFGMTAAAVCFALMSFAHQLNQPRSVSGRFVAADTGDGVPNVMIWLHPANRPLSFARAESKPKTVVAEYFHDEDPNRARLVPKYILMRPGDTLQFKNRAKYGSNPNLAGMSNSPFNVVANAGGDCEFELMSAERSPILLHGSIRSDWRGYVLVTDSPAAVSDNNGNWTLPELPPGEHIVRIWNENSGWVKHATLEENGHLTLAKPPGGKKKNACKLRVGLATRSIGDCPLEVVDGVPQ